MKRRLLTVAIAALTSFGAFAQNYYVLKTTGTTAPYVFNTGPTSTNIILPVADQVYSAEQFIPFAWNFYGTPVTSYLASDNGYITFDNTATTSYQTNSVLPSAGGPNNAIYALWTDLKINTVAAPALEAVRSWTYGTAPNRVHVIQWFGVSPAVATTSELILSIRLYEGGDFDVVYDYATAPNLSGIIGVENATGTVATMVGTAATSPGANTADQSDDKVYSFIFGTQPAYDATITKLNMNPYAGVGSNIVISGTMANLGSATITGFDLNYSVDGGSAVTQHINASIAASGGTYNFSHSVVYTPTTTGPKSIKVWATNLSNTNPDGNTVNDDKTMVINVLSQLGTRKLLLEGFSSSTCGPCNPGNANVHSILESRDRANYTIVKYQEYYPALGDPYATTESINRMDYYAINSIPRLELDGAWDGNSNSFTDQIMDQYLAKPALLDITATHTINYHTVAVDVTITPYADIPANAKLHIAIVESITNKNVKSNGETEFFSVMKKMIPNQNGTTLAAMPAGTPVVIPTKTYSFPGGYRLPSNARSDGNAYPPGASYSGINLSTENTVEDFNNLEVVVFVQNSATKEVYNSNWSTGTFLSVKKSATGNSFGLYPNPASTSIMLDFSLAAKEDITFDVIDVLGKVVKTETMKGLSSGDHSISLNTSELNNGVYYLNLKSNGTVTTQKFVVAK